MFVSVNGYDTDNGAVKAVRNSEIALVFVGSSSTAFVRHSNEPSTSGEGIDLSDISLTGAQEQLIRSVWRDRQTCCCGFGSR